MQINLNAKFVEVIVSPGDERRVTFVGEAYASASEILPSAFTSGRRRMPRGLTPWMKPTRIEPNH